MKYLKIYKLFLEDGEGGAIAGSGDAGFSTGGNAYANATIAGMGNITNAIVGDLPGVSGVSGSGDVTVDSKRCKRKKGNPTQVTDLRDLDEVETNKIEESAIISGDEISEYDLNIIKDLMVNLTDIGFDLIQIHGDKTVRGIEKINIYLIIQTSRINRGIEFFHWSDNKEIIQKSELIMAGGRRIKYTPNEFERKILDISDDISLQLVNMIEYDKITFEMTENNLEFDILLNNDYFDIVFELSKDIKTNKIEESVIISGDEISEYDLNIIRDSLLELNDIGFNLIQIHSDKTIDTEKINICLEIKTNRMNKGIRLHYLFNSDIIINKNEKILGGGINGDKLINHMLNEFEQKIVDVCDYDIHQLMNMLNCYTAIVDIFQDDYCSTDIFKIEIDLIRNNEQDKIEESLNIKPIRESYYSKQEYFQEIQYSLEKYNIRPIVLNNILDMYENDILKNWEDGVSPKIFVDNIVKELELDKGGYMNFRKPIGNLQTTIKYL